MRLGLFFLIASAISFACALPLSDDATDCKDDSFVLL